MRRWRFEEQARPLYYWKLNLDGSVDKYVVSRYRIYGTVRTHYNFQLEDQRSTIHSIKEEQMNRFLNGRVCSFEDDDKKAKKIIEDTLTARVNKFKYEYDNASALLEAFRGAKE